MLIIAEKPNQGKDIARVLGVSGDSKKGFMESNGITVIWCYGHMLRFYDPYEYKNLSFPYIPDKWLQTTEGKKNSKDKEFDKRKSSHFKVMKKIISQAKEIVIATDADREGEMIGWEILEYAGYKGKVKRLWLSALDDKSIKKAFDNLLDGESKYKMYLEAQSRSKADWLYGWNYSRIYNSPVGRVQTPTLAIVVNRDREIENFKPVNYFELFGTFIHKNGEFKAKWAGNKEEKILDKKIIERIADGLKNESTFIINIEKKIKKETAPKLFSLSELQKRLSAVYGFSADETLSIAQSLYEKYKYTTYPRSDCQYLPLSQLDDAKTIVKNIKNVLKLDIPAPVKSYHFNDAEVSKSSHHAIIPTQVEADLDKLNDNEKKAYREICKRYAAMFYPDFAYEETVVTAGCGKEPFEAKGCVVTDKGWKAVYGAENKEELLPKMSIKDSLKTKEFNIEEKKTTPPARFTDGTLIDAMKNAGKFTQDKKSKEILKDIEGIGTEATRSSIIKGLVDGKIDKIKKVKISYLKKSGKNLISTEEGRNLIDKVEKKLKSPELTAIWEEELKKIGAGESGPDGFLRRLISDLRIDMEGLKKSNITLNGGSSVEKQYLEGVKCPLCGSKLVYFSKGFKCETQNWDGKETTGCNFTLWSTQCGQKLSDKDILNLLSGKKVAGKFKITSKAGKTYEAPFIYLDDKGDVKLEFEQKEAKA